MKRWPSAYVEVYICEQELDEIRRVIARPKFDKFIGIAILTYNELLAKL